MKEILVINPRPKRKKKGKRKTKDVAPFTTKFLRTDSFWKDQPSLKADKYVVQYKDTKKGPWYHFAGHTTKKSAQSHMKNLRSIYPGTPYRVIKAKSQYKQNPTRKGKTMARKRKRRTPTRSIVRRRTPRRNPSRTRTAARRAGGALRSLFTARNLVDSVKQVGGMMATQFFAKRFADGGGANDQDWSWQNYTWGLAGATASGLVAEMIKPGSGKEFFKGGLSLLGYKLIVNELSDKSEFISEYFGEGDIFLGTDGNQYSPGDTYLGQDGEVYLLGQDGMWRPTSDEYRNAGMYMGPPTSLGETVMPPSSLGETVMPPSSLGEDPYARVFGEDPYARAFGAYN